MVANTGKIRFQVQNALAASAAAWAAGLNPAFIVRALTTFKTDTAMNPGRFNLSDVNGIQVLLDYGHNLAAIQALGEAVEALGKRKTVMVLGLPGDRRDEDLIATLEATFPFVDAYVLHDLENRREREPNEVPRLLINRLPDHKRHAIAADEEQAIIRAWRWVSPGDRLIVIADIAEKTIQILDRLVQSVAGDAACETPLDPAAARTQ